MFLSPGVSVDCDGPYESLEKLLPIRRPGYKTATNLNPVPSHMGKKGQIGSKAVDQICLTEFLTVMFHGLV